MKTHLIILATLSLLLVSTLTNAGEGFYAGVSIGSSSLDEDFDGLRINDDTSSLRISAGWWVNQHLSLEVGYQDFGNFEQAVSVGGVNARARLSADGYTFGVTGQIPLSKRVSLMGRFGAFFWDGEAEINNVSQASPDDVNPYIGIGLGFALNDKFSLLGDITQYQLEDADTTALSVGVQYHF